MTDGSTPPPNRSHGPHPTGTPATPHQVVVAPTLGTVLGHSIFSLVFLVVGIGALVFAFVRPGMADRTTMFVLGGVFTLLGLLFCLTLRRTLTSRTFTFTETALEGTDSVGRPFRLPWADLESIAIAGRARRNLLFQFLHGRLPSAYAYLRIRVWPDMEHTGAMASWPERKYVRVRFWNRQELIDSFASGCRTFAGDRFIGVLMS